MKENKNILAVMCKKNNCTDEDCKQCIHSETCLICPLYIKQENKGARIEQYFNIEFNNVIKSIKENNTENAIYSLDNIRKLIITILEEI